VLAMPLFALTARPVAVIDRFALVLYIEFIFTVLELPITVTIAVAA
jgi:hypothetical protein